MVVPESRIRKEQIALARLGSTEVGVILAWYLNGQLVRDPNSPDPPEWDAANRDAIAELVTHLHTLDALNGAAENEDADKQFTATLDWINTFLRQYNATPGLEAYRGSPPWEWTLYLHASDEEFSPKAVELRMMTAAMESARAGRISLLKRCGQCHRWMFARFSHQRFCGQECKKAFHTTNPVDKKRRADWMRKNYKKQKRKVAR